jgi:hypothetical protein
MSKRPTAGKVKQGITFLRKALWEIHRDYKPYQHKTVGLRNMSHTNPNSEKLNTGTSGNPLILAGEVSLNNIAMLAKENPEMIFTSLVHRVDLSLLKEAFRRIKKGKATGVDKVAAADYAVDLDQNLYNLHQRLRRGQYVATPVKRIWIEKENGKQRPIGIPALEDKIVQKAAEMILSVIYEPIFYDFSHGFRPGHNQHMAIRELRESCIKNKTNWIVSADITGLFDNIDHGHRIHSRGMKLTNKDVCFWVAIRRKRVSEKNISFCEFRAGVIGFSVICSSNADKKAISRRNISDAPETGAAIYCSTGRNSSKADWGS